MRFGYFHSIVPGPYFDFEHPSNVAPSEPLGFQMTILKFDASDKDVAVYKCGGKAFSLTFRIRYNDFILSYNQ